MAMAGIPPQARDPHVTPLHIGAVTIAVVSGICALVALAVGSPLQFGIALALFGAGWMVADFIESTPRREHECVAQRRVVPALRFNPGYESCHVVYVGSGEHFSHPASRTGIRLAA